MTVIDLIIAVWKLVWLPVAMFSFTLCMGIKEIHDHFEYKRWEKSQKKKTNV